MANAISCEDRYDIKISILSITLEPERSGVYITNSKHKYIKAIPRDILDKIRGNLIFFFCKTPLIYYFSYTGCFFYFFKCYASN